MTTPRRRPLLFAAVAACAVGVYAGFLLGPYELGSSNALCCLALFPLLAVASAPRVGDPEHLPEPATVRSRFRFTHTSLATCASTTAVFTIWALLLPVDAGHHRILDALAFLASTALSGGLIVLTRRRADSATDRATAVHSPDTQDERCLP